MEFQFMQVDIPEEKSFSVLVQQYDTSSVIHMHKNYELNFVTSGSGKRIVGNHISSFESNDLILIGPNLLHHREFSETEKNIPPECLILYISESLINRDLVQIKELEAIHDLFKRAINGVAFKGDSVKLIKQQILQLAELQGSDGFIALLKLLKSLTEIEEQEILSLTPEFTVSQYKDLDQIKIVYNYVLLNIQDTITLDAVSGLLNMAPGSFCRFFKKRTGKSFLQYVKDIRISIASKMLSNTEKPIAQICFESGYNNLANFNFYFRSIMKMTPSEYRRNFR
ncbi:MAG: helix-turn-helix transcriptional regulator [Mariniphaga sp.]|nr:helix-turn-helix transcriptional regulator [Mariniphaga sp.]